MTSELKKNNTKKKNILLLEVLCKWSEALFSYFKLTQVSKPLRFIFKGTVEMYKYDLRLIARNILIVREGKMQDNRKGTNVSIFKKRKYVITIDIDL